MTYTYNEIVRFELPDKTAFNAAMPGLVREEERVWFQGEQYGVGQVYWEVREDEDEDGPNGSFYGYGFEDRGWDQYVVLVKCHVRSVKGDYNSPLVSEGRHWPV